ncbi:TPA: LysR substrate-binding domain-containing protein [Mannheimia haemolytica]
MNPKNTTLHALEIFLAVAREKNFSEVARQYDVASSVISRQIKQLEDDFGQTLFYRNTRAMSLTQAGEQFAKHAHAMLSQFQSLNEELHRSNQEPHGIIRLNAPVFFGQKHIAPHLAELHRRYPKLHIQLTQTDDFIDPYSETADVIFRVSALVDSNLKLRIIAPQRHFLLASPSYLAQHGTPKQLSDLPQHQGLFYRGQLGVLHWRFGKQGKQIEAQPMLISNNANSLIETAVNGGGLLMMPDWAVHHELRNGTLVQVLPDQPISSQESEIFISMLTPQSTYRPVNVQAVMDFFIEKLDGGKCWQVESAV